MEKKGKKPFDGVSIARVCVHKQLHFRYITEIKDLHAQRYQLKYICQQKFAYIGKYEGVRLALLRHATHTS